MNTLKNTPLYSLPDTKDNIKHTKSITNGIYIPTSKPKDTPLLNVQLSSKRNLKQIFRKEITKEKGIKYLYILISLY